MGRQVKTLDQLKDSRIMFDKEPPAFGYFLIWIFGGFLCAALIWSIRTPKVYTIEAQGTVTSEESNYVMCSYTGEIDECNMTEGMIVEEAYKKWVQTTCITVFSTCHETGEEI